MKSLNDEILALSTLFEAGRISKKDFESLKKDAEEADAKRVEALKTESAPKKLDYSADSDLPLTRIPMKEDKSIPKATYNWQGKEPAYKRDFNEKMIFVGVKMMSFTAWVYIISYSFGILLLVAILFGFDTSSTREYFRDKSPSAAEVARAAEESARANAHLNSMMGKASFKKESPEEAAARVKLLRDNGVWVPGE